MSILATDLGRVLWLYVLDASRTSGESRATIIVGDAMRGAAWVATLMLALSRF